MMKRVMSLFSVILCAMGVYMLLVSPCRAAGKCIRCKDIQEPSIRCAVRKYDRNKDGWLSEKERKKVTSLELDAEYYELDLGELKYFTSLKRFSVLESERVGIRKVKHISTLFRLKKLQKLSLSQCNLNKKGLKTSVWKNLNMLEVRDCKLKKLSLAKNKKLETLSCEGNSISSLSLTKNKKLRAFSCGGTRLKKLNLSMCKKLERLSLNRDKDVEICDVKLYKNGKRLKRLEFLGTLNRDTIDLTGWKLSGLREIVCAENYADGGDGYESSLKHVLIGDVPKLEQAEFDTHIMETLVVGKSPRLKKLSCASRVMKTIALVQRPAELSCADECRIEILK